jgi:uncharacterized protein YciI
MALFMLACFDKPNSLDLRMANREAHLAYAREHLAMIKIAGPLLDEADAMAGSMFILEAPNRAAVEAFNAADPYQTAGLFGQVEIRGYRVSIGQL